MGRGRGEGEEVSTRSRATMDVMADQLGFRQKWMELDETSRQEFVFPQMLDYVDFSGLDLSHVDLSRRSLYGANLADTVLKGTNFTGADLRAVKLHGAEIDGPAALEEAANKDWLSLDELEAKIETLPIIVDNNGVEVLRYWEKGGKLHRRLDKPAVIWSNGAKAYYTLGKLVRHEVPGQD